VDLLEGFTIDSLVIDLTGVRAGRVGTDLGVSVLARKMRANIATERPGKTRLREAAGTASGISLPPVASALGLPVPVQGVVRGSKVTFRSCSAPGRKCLPARWRLAVACMPTSEPLTATLLSPATA